MRLKNTNFLEDWAKFCLFSKSSSKYCSMIEFKVLNVNFCSFPNDPCFVDGGSKNGTCYTSEECENKGGSNSGSCAEGFGVCCRCKSLASLVTPKTYSLRSFLGSYRWLRSQHDGKLHLLRVSFERHHRQWRTLPSEGLQMQLKYLSNET